MARHRAKQPAPRRRFHKLASHQPALDFVNTRLDDTNYRALLGAGVIPEEIMDVNCTLAGRHTISRGAAAQLQSCVRLVLERFLRGDDEPLRTFKVAGREPFGSDVSIFKGEIGTGWAAANDLQDFWYYRVAELIRMHKRSGQQKFLARCMSPGCGRFYFRKRAGDNTCGERRCAQSLHYQKHKNKRRSAGRPRSRVTIPSPRSKRRRT